MALAFCLAYKAGLWAARLKPPRHKAHGRLQRSIFAFGLNVLRKAMVKSSEPEPGQLMAALLTSKIPRSPQIGWVL